MTSDKIINIDRVCYTYGQGQVVSDISLGIARCEFTAIIGPNGAGKSTLMKLIGGMLSPRSGSVTMNGTNIRALPRKTLAKSLAYVPQESDFTFDYTVGDVVRMGRYPYIKGVRSWTAEDEKIVTEVMRLLDITEFSDRCIRELSGGEKQRVIVASALAQQPEILLLDEPTAALDLHHQIGIYKILSDQQRAGKLTVLIVTHDINLAAQYCKRIILLDKGYLIVEGVPGDVLQFQRIQDIFGVNVYIDINPLTKSLYVLPYA